MLYPLWFVLATRGENITTKQMQDLEAIASEISTAARARMVSVQDTASLFARLNIESERAKTPHQMSSAVPATELRQNVTRRRSIDRARDSVGSTSVPIRSLVSRRPLERPKDVSYANESEVVMMQEHGASIATPVHSPGITRRLIPSEAEDPLRHKVLNEMWIRKKILEEDIDDSLVNQNSVKFHDLVQQHKRMNQDMVDMLAERLDSSPPLAQIFNLDEESFAIWLAYDGDEIAVVVWPQMSVKTLIERTVEILESRGVVVMFEQILLRHEGKTFDNTLVLSDYDISSDDIVEVLVSRSVRSPRAHIASATKDDDRSLDEPPRDIFLPPRDIFGAAEARGGLMDSGSNGNRAVQRDFPNSIPARDIFGDAKTGGVLVDSCADQDRSVQRDSSRLHPATTSPSHVENNSKFYGIRKGFQIGVCETWTELQRRIAGFPHPEFSTFNTWEETKTYVLQGMWRDMPDGPRQYVNPVPQWTVPRTNSFADPVQHTGRSCNLLAPATVGRALPSWNLPGSRTQVDRASYIGGAQSHSPVAIPIGRMSNMEHASNMGSTTVGRVTKGHDKIKQAFKCPRFSGNAKDWKIWNKGFLRFLSIWDIDYVLDPSFFDELSLSAQKVNDNKMVYFILEDATQGSPLAASYVRQAPVKNGFEAYYTLHDGFVFAGSTSSTILLNELANFRFKMDESPTALIMRLEELLQDLEMLPDGAAVTFNDTQRIGYLLGALRHEPEWATVTSSITSSQLRGEMTFRQACNELRFRCEAERAYDIMDKEVKTKRKVPIMGAKVEEKKDATSVETSKALISSEAKRLNKDNAKEDKRKFKCLAKECSTKTAFPLCGLHYHSIVSGKSASLDLENNMGSATYNVTTKLIEYPATVPKERPPQDRSKGGVTKQ